MIALRRPTLVLALLFSAVAPPQATAQASATPTSPASTVAPQPAERPTPDAQAILILTNQDRTQQGLQPLHWDPALAAAAQAHAEKMAATRSLSHQLPGEAELPTRASQAGAHFAAIAENIAVGYSPTAIERKWMDSTPHRTNILDPRMNAIGIGMVERDHDYFAVEDFADGAPLLSSTAVEDQVKQLLREQGIDPSLPRTSAAPFCHTGSNAAAAPGIRTLIRFDAPQVNQLPQSVIRKLQTLHLTHAAVAACPARIVPQTAFTSYSVVIALY